MGWLWSVTVSKPLNPKFLFKGAHRALHSFIHYLFIQEILISFGSPQLVCCSHVLCHSFAYSQPLTANTSNLSWFFSRGLGWKCQEQSSTSDGWELVNKYSGFLSSQFGYLWGIKLPVSQGSAAGFSFSCPRWKFAGDTLFTGCLPPPAHFPTPVLVIPGITFHIKCFHSHLLLKVFFRGEPT